MRTEYSVARRKWPIDWKSKTIEKQNSKSEYVLAVLLVGIMMLPLPILFEETPKTTYVKEESGHTECQFGHVSRDSRNIPHINGIQDDLDHAKGTPGALEEIVPYVPALGGLSFPVVHHLFRILGQRAAYLEKGQPVKIV